MPHKAQLGTRCEQCHKETGLAPASGLRSRCHALPADRTSRHRALRGMPPLDLIQGSAARLRELPQGSASRRPADRAIARCATTRTAGCAGASIITRRPDTLWMARIEGSIATPATRSRRPPRFRFRALASVATAGRRPSRLVRTILRAVPQHGIVQARIIRR